MKRKAYCKSCETVKPYRRSLNVKSYAGLWAILLFDCLCKKCNTITFQNIEAIAPSTCGTKKFMMMCSAPVSLGLDLVNVTEHALTGNRRI